MKHAIAGLLVLLTAVVLLSGCSGYCSPVKPPVGLVYSEVFSTQDVNFDKTAVTSKSGQAMAKSVMGLVSWGDCSAQTAARNGSLKQINHSDYRFFTVLGVYSEYTTIVYGE